jgi:hypothetical protein
MWDLKTLVELNRKRELHLTGDIMEAEIIALVAMLADHIDDAKKVDEEAYGWKSANLRIRKTTLAVEKKMKALRKHSIGLEK